MGTIEPCIKGCIHTDPLTPQQRTVHIKAQAKAKAIENVFYNIYRHQMRYEPIQYQDEFGLTDEDVSLILKHNTETEYPLIMITINFKDLADMPTVAGPSGKIDHRRAIRASRKIWIKECLVGFELGKEGNHPHYHFLLSKSREWVARSRMVQEFSNTFKDTPHSVDIKYYQSGELSKMAKYVMKEDIWIYGKIEKYYKKEK